MWNGREGAKMIIRDSYKLELPKDKAILDSVKTEMTVIKDNQGVPALEVVIDASHGGYVNANFSMYTKEGQQAGAKSFITPFPKPVLVEHDDNKPPIGRVVDSQYVDIPVDQTQMAVAGEKGRPTSKVTVKAVITDMDAIQKLMDGRFMTVSISGRPKAAPICSICNKIVDGPFGCEDGHVRGKKYDGKLAYYMIGEMSYSEVSFVNKPADQSESHAAVVSSMKAITAPTFAATDSTVGDIKDSTGTDVNDMKRENYLAEAASEGGHSHRLFIDPATGNGRSDWILAHSHDVINKVVQSASIRQTDAAGNEVVMEPHMHKFGKKIAPLTDAQIMEMFEDNCPECEDKYWTEEDVTALKELSAEYDQLIESDEMGDAKLSTAQRKKLKSSTFCGPGRSFPVPDCAHVTAARRLIGRYKGSSSTKAKILACVSRKAKNLGCGGDSSDEALVLLEEAKNQLMEQVKILTEQKKQAEDMLKEANAKIEQTLSDLTKAQDELKKLQEATTIEAAKTATQIGAAENQHKQDLAQNADLTARLKEKIAANIVGLSLLLRKDGLLNVFGGNTIEDRVNSYNTSVSKYKDTPLEDLIKLEKQHLDELTKITMVGHNIGPVDGPNGDPLIAKQIKTITDRRSTVRGWFYGQA